VPLALAGWLITGPPEHSPNITIQSGDTIQGIQYKAGRDIHIGITLEQYEAGLKRREQEVTKALKQAHEQERQILEKEKSEIERRLAGTRASYQSYVKELQERIAHLERIRGQIPDVLLDQARTALAQGDRSQASQLFAQIKAQTKAAIQAAAEADYQLSRIALDEIRYREAYQHAQRSVRLVPENSLYLAGAGELAQMLGDYSAAKTYHEQALASDLNAYGEDHPRVATHRNNLGGAWRALGEYKEAIGYYEQALASDLATYGEDHPHVAAIRNNLGGVWESLGEYKKAIGYYEQALVSDLKTYGEDHPAVATTRNNLGSAWQDLGEYEKAIGYYEQALASDLNAYGEDHPHVAIRRNNLGLAWQALGSTKRPSAITSRR